MQETPAALLEHQMKYCNQILHKLKRNNNVYPFLEPVDPEKYGIPDYPLKIKFPMDLSTIKKKLDSNIYKTPEMFDSDIKLMFNNCYTYNHPTTEVYIMGKKLEAFYSDLYQLLPTEIQKKKKKLEVYDRSKHIKRTIRSGDGMSLEEYEFCIELIEEINKPKHKNIIWPFLEPVDEKIIPQYYEVIKNPMTLLEIRDKLNNKIYQSIDEFREDLRLVYENCFKFNEAGSDVYKCGSELKELINLLFEKYEPKDLKGRIIELKNKISQYIKEVKKLENKYKEKGDYSPIAIKKYTLNERIELGNRILNLDKIQTNHVAKIIQKHSAGEYMENNEIEVDLRVIPDFVYEEIDEYISSIEIGLEEDKSNLISA